MSLWRQLTYGLRGLVNREGRDREVADEVEQYFEEAAAEWESRGLSPKEARRAARRDGGSMTAAREQAGSYGWENGVKVLSDDLRFAARQLWKHPAFTVTAMLTLALGIGANAAIFTVVESVLLAPLPYHNAERLAQLETYRSQIGRAIPRVTWPDAMDVRSQSRNLETVSVYNGGKVGVELRDHSAYSIVTFADTNFARVFALRPMAGRLFTAEEHAAMVSERFARDNFGAAQAAVGQVVRIEGEPEEIVGVLPEGFDYPGGTQVWVASHPQPAWQGRTSFNFKAVALLRDGAGFTQTGTELEALSGRLEAAYPKDNRGKAMRVKPLKEALTGDSRQTLLFLWAAAGLILLIACVNVMHLQLVRSMERQRELAIRRALGSSRWRVMQPVFLESVMVAMMGGAAGVALAFPAVKVLVAMAPKELPRAAEIHLNLWVLGFALALTLGTAIVSAMLPAMRASKVDPADALKCDASRGMTRHGAGLMRDGLVVAEVAATFVLAVGAGLLLRTMMVLNARDMGYQTRQMLVVDADAPVTQEMESLRAVGMFDELFAQLREMPGVEKVAGVMGLPTGSYGSNGYYETKGGETGGGLPVDPDHPAWSNFTVASPGYFAAMGIPLKRGRDFGAEDTHESGMVAVISEALAKQSFGAADPVGRQIKCGLDADKWMTVVGVVGDVRQESPADVPGATLYMPMTQHPFYANQIHIVLRTTVKPLTLMHAVEERIAKTNPLIARRYTTMDALMDQSIATERFRAALISSFAGVGLVLAMLGVYGTIAYSVAQRRFEFGVRMAFGAERGAILRSVLGHAARLACVGIVAGTVLSVMLARLVTSMLVGVRPADPASLGMVSALLLVTAVCAALAPGWSATRVDPMVALRAE